jgi:hypothetical protein
MASLADGLILGGRAEQAESAMLLSRKKVQADFHPADFSPRVHEAKNRQKAVIFYPAGV